MIKKIKQVFISLLIISIMSTTSHTTIFASTSPLSVTWLNENYDEVYDFHYRAARVKKDNKWGIIDKTGKEIVPAIYDIIYGFEYEFKDGFTLVMNDGKYGLINNKGHLVVPVIYDQIEAFSEGLARVTKDDKLGFIDRTGKVIIPLKYDRASLGFKEGLVAVAIKISNEYTGYRWGYVDKSGKEVIPLKYTFANDFSEGLAWVAKGDKYDIYYGAIDKSGNQVINFKYSNVRDFSYGIARVGFGGNNYEYIDKAGNTIISSGFDSGRDCIEGMVWTESYVTGGSWYYLNDSTGKRIPLDGPYYTAGDFENGLARVSKQGGISTYIDKTGKEIYPARASISGFVEGFAMVIEAVENKPKYGFIDTKGKVVVPFIYDGVDFFNEGMAVVRIGKNMGYVDITGEMVLSVPYPVAHPFYEGIALVREGMHYGAIDKTGKVIIPIMYQNISNFKEEYAIVTDDNFRKGVVDSTGEVVVPLNFNKISDFNEGLAIAKKDGKWAIIETPNSYIYDLDKETTALPTASKVMVNGKYISFDAYNINGNNYFKLRDLAFVLKGTEKQFDLRWDDSKRAINIISNKSYAPNGEEMLKGDGIEKIANLNTSDIYIDGVKVILSAYNINGNNYFKLRDIGKVFDFTVVWDEKNNSIIIDTIREYEKE